MIDNLIDFATSREVVFIAWLFTGFYLLARSFNTIISAIENLRRAYR